MNLQTALNRVAPYDAENSYAEFAKIMENAYIELSFWGGRNVYSVGYQGSVSLETVALKIKELVDSHPEFNLGERKLGFIIQNKTWTLYNINEHQEKKANIITLFFIGLREFSKELIYYTVSNSMLFDYCTLKQYREVTHKEPNPQNASGDFLKDPDEQVPLWFLPKEEQELFEYSNLSKNK